MLRVTTIYAASAGSAAAYYTRYLAEAPGEVPGVWAGHQADALGLTGPVTGDQLRALLEGRDPVSGSPLGRLFADRTLADGGVVRAVAGFDATFSAPKSLSVLWALTQDDRYLAAHDTAVRAALAHLERFGATTRIRAGNGRLHPDSQGLTMGVFRQTTSRADDPQIHTHVVISAKVQTDDGRWLALDARYLKRYQRMLGGLYQTVLRNELTHCFGVAWSPIEHGQAEIVGVPDELRDVFSKRAGQVEQAVAVKRAEFVDRQGREPNQWELAALKREAAADTRATKSGSPVTELMTRWTGEAAAVGWTAPDLVAAVLDAGREHLGTPPGVDVGEIVAALSTGGSTWNRADVVSAVCDLARPNPNINGTAWAAIIEHAADTVIGGCVELDPTHTEGPRRRSDGRSLWLEPTAPHLTTEQVLREEELVLAWALDAHTDEPRPSVTVHTAGLDAFQADAAAAVAGRDRLVVVVGPAGTGKTTTLAAAVDDLDHHGRVVFGVAPTAKAARVLERETGISSDTLAKLLHEWHRPDRPPHPRYHLPAGTTIVIDEAGMVSTPALAQLTTLATTQGWRLALIGDPHQLQAVGRGGLFHELCATSRTVELQHIHRFTSDWEPAASLQLRHANPRGWDPYLQHGRVTPGSFEEHLETAAHRWLATTNAGETISIVAATNDHVDALNTAIQHARVEVGQLDPAVNAPIGGSEQAMVGDYVVTRRNNRHLTTSTSEPIRNRETWTITAIGIDGALTVTSNHGHGTAILPVDYTREHVRLGYAATEHGVQGDTTTTGLALISTATTRRGAYVAMTRGRNDNTALVITDTHDPDEARDLLDRIITVDRADIPATTQRRALSTADHSPRRPPPRCEVPDWLTVLRNDLTDEIDAAERRAVQRGSQLVDLRSQLADVHHELARANRNLDPHRPTLDTAASNVQAAQERVWTTFSRALHLTGRHRRAANREHQSAQHDLTTAKQQQTDVTAAAARARQAVNDVHQRIHDLHQRITSTETAERLDRPHDRTDHALAIRHALDEWEHWATGKPIPTDRVIAMTETLRSTDATQTEYDALATAIEQWATARGIDLTPQRPALTARQAPEIHLGM